MALFEEPIGHYAGMQVIVIDAQRQARTARDVRGSWVRPGRVPSKRAGRKGTRRAWKRANPPCWSWLYREPTDVLMLPDRKCIVTPRQRAQLEHLSERRRRNDAVDGLAYLFFNPTV